MLVSREIAADGDRKRLRVTPMADGGWYVMMADGRNHASVSLSAAEFAFLFRLSSADAS